MLPLENRIKKKKEFEAVFKEGEAFHSGLFTVILSKSETEEKKFGFIVSKKVSSKAVSRNRVKRISREQVRLMLPRIRKGVNIIIIAKKEALKQDSKKIKAELESLFIKKEII
jgi:ribonuclease P protein component